MLKYSISSAEDFAKLAEDTERLVQHIEDVRNRMAAAAKRRQSRPDAQELSSEHPPPAPKSDAPAAPHDTQPPSTGVTRAASGVYRILRERDWDRDVEQHCAAAERRMRELVESPTAPHPGKPKSST